MAIGVVQGCLEHEPDRVTILAAASMSGVLSELESAFEILYPGIDLECVFAGSQTLAMQINEGAPADVFISADHFQMMRVEGFGSTAVIAQNRLVLIQPPKPETLSAVQALNHASRIVIAQIEVPAGRYTQAALDELEVWETTEPKIVSYEHSVRGVLNKIMLRQADLGVVYLTDALSESESVSMIEFPSGISTVTQTWIAMRENAGNVDPTVSLAYRFILESPESRQILTEYGFETTNKEP